MQIRKNKLIVVTFQYLWTLYRILEKIFGSFGVPKRGQSTFAGMLTDILTPILSNIKQEHQNTHQLQQINA